MDDDELRRLIGTAAPRASRRVDIAAIRRRGRQRRAARGLGGASAAVLALAGLVAILLPPGDVVVLQPGVPDLSDVEEPQETTPDPEPSAEPTVTPTAEPTTEPQPMVTAEPQPQVPEEASHRNGAELWGRKFVGMAISENGRPKELVPGTEIRLRFDYFTEPKPPHGLTAWGAGCNAPTARLEVQPGQLIVGNWFSHAMGCSDEITEQQRWLDEFFFAHPYWRLDGERLLLWSGDTIIEWQVDHRPPPPRCESDCEVMEDRE